jgi:hypothetical protein
MAMDDPSLLELLELLELLQALRAAGVDDRIRLAARGMYRALIGCFCRFSASYATLEPRRR